MAAMNTRQSATDTPAPDEKRRLVFRAAAQSAAQVPVMALALFAPAGTLDWPAAWAVLAVYIAGSLLLNLWLIARHPGLARERLVIPRATEPWDVRLTKVSNFLLLACLLPLAGLDHRLGFSPPFPAAISAGALILFAAMFAAIGWAMSYNEYFSSLVRLQSDRDHAVADRGPYRVLRHPGYLMMILQFLFVPVVLGSLPGAVPAAAIAAVYIYRTAREDRFLLERLPGYADYARQVRWRLVPGIW
jgi:protein-S-isoprenylcysteine O-methyltransferase Ste14